MERIPEPELMDEPAQALAYARADFDGPNTTFVEELHARFADLPDRARALDLGCGPADIVARLARRHPAWRFDAVDGAREMLRHAETVVRDAGVDDRVRLVHGRVQELDLGADGYDVVLSNSLLHHLGDPMHLWRAVRRAARPGAVVQVMDLSRPADEAEVRRLVDLHGAPEPDVLRRDFTASLHAAYRPDEVRSQLAQAGIEGVRVEQVTDRHLLAWGRMS